MRSSFVIGGLGGEHNSDIKRKEQQEWLQDLGELCTNKVVVVVVGSGLSGTFIHI